MVQFVLCVSTSLMIRGPICKDMQIFFPAYLSREGCICVLVDGWGDVHYELYTITLITTLRIFKRFLNACAGHNLVFF